MELEKLHSAALIGDCCLIALISVKVTMLRRMDLGDLPEPVNSRHFVQVRNTFDRFFFKDVR